MRAARYTQFGDPDVLHVVEVPDPHPGPGQIRVAVHAAGIGPTDCKARRGLLGGGPPMTTGREVAGVVDAVDQGVTGVALGDRVFGFSDDEDGAGAAELALVRHWAPVPAGLGFIETAGVPVVAETAARSLRALGVGRTGGSAAAGDHAVDGGTDRRTLLVSGASGGIGTAAVQLAVAQGLRVIGTARPAHHDYLRQLGAEPVAYGPGLVERVRALSPAVVDLALDVAGSGVLGDLVELTGDPGRVVTIADRPGAQRLGVHFSTGEDGRAVDVLGPVADLMASGRFRLPVAQVFPLEEIAAAHRLVESDQVRGRVVLAVR